MVSVEKVKNRSAALSPWSAMTAGRAKPPRRRLPRLWRGWFWPARWSLHLRDNFEHAVPPESDHGKIAAVGREDGADVFPLGEVSQGSVGELQAEGFVAFHQGRDGGQGIGVDWEQGEQSALKAVEHLNERIRSLAKEPGCFRDDRPAGQEETAEKGAASTEE